MKILQYLQLKAKTMSHKPLHNCSFSRLPLAEQTLLDKEDENSFANLQILHLELTW